MKKKKNTLPRHFIYIGYIFQRVIHSRIDFTDFNMGEVN